MLTLQEENKLLKKALIDLVGVSNSEELIAMKSFLLNSQVSDKDKFAMTNAIDVILYTNKQECIMDKADKL